MSVDIMALEWFARLGVVVGGRGWVLLVDSVFGSEWSMVYAVSSMLFPSPENGKRRTLS